MRKRIVSLLMALVMVFSLIPTTVLAAEGDTAENLGTVHVIVENNTFPKAKGAAWDGKLVDTWVDLNPESTMMSCVAKALDAKGYKAGGTDSTYISEIEGLKTDLTNAGEMSGWMGTLNDWFVNDSFASFTVANGKLTAGDEIRVMYSCTADDLGGTWDNQDKTVKELTISGAALSPAFDKDTHEYTLTIDKDATSVVVTPTASNKNYQVRTSVDGKEYKRGAAIPVSDGTVITVKCGDPSWPSMNPNTGEAQVYTINVVVAGSEPPAPVVTTANVTIRSQMAGDYLHGFAEPVEVASNLAERYGFTDSVDGVSALDVLVKAHEIVFEDAFTADTAGDYLAVSDAGFITKIFSEETGNCGFTINGETPHDGILKDDDYAPGKKSYTGYTVAQAKVTTGDTVEFFLYQDSYALDNYPLWERNGISLDSLTVKPEAVVDITVKGYCIGYYGCVPMDALVENGQVTALEDAQLAWVDTESGSLTDIENAVVDEDGNVSFTAPATAGTYYLAAYMPADKVEDEFTTPVIMSILPVTVDENAPDLEGGTDVTLTGLHDMQVKYLKLYTYKDGVKGEKDLLEGISTVADGYILKYNAKLFAGDYWVEGYDANDERNGGMKITVDADHTSFEIKRIYEISVNPSSWQLNEDYTLDIKVTGADNQLRKIERGTTTSGKGQAWEKTNNTFIFVLGDTVEATATPNAEKYSNYNPGVAKKTPTSNENISITCGEFVTVTIKAPAGSKIILGTLAQYYVYSYLDAVEVTKDETAVTATFHANKNTTYFYRVQNENGVTYWNYTKWAANTEIEVTAEELHIGDAKFTKDTIYRFEKNVYDRADIYLNINAQGYKNMAVGETFELNVFRNWFLIESYMNSQVALPDMHYQVIDVNGNPSDVLTITPDEKNSSVANMKANKAGTAIVLVTYDAVTHMNGQGGHEYSAIWPECTGVFIVTVDNDGTGIQTNMVLDRMDAVISKDEARQLDAEHDILFYLGSEGAEYSFKPEDGCTVSVARSTVSDKMTFSGFTYSGVTVAEDGTVTITGLTTGRHIVKVEKDGKANYQVITARGVSYKLVDKDGNELSEEAKAAIKAGDTVYLQFSNLVSPKEKLSGAYNFNFSLYYKGEDDTYFQSDSGGRYGVYDFSGNPARQKIAITIPKYWDGNSYTLTGAIKQGGFGGVPTHRGITYAAGTNPGFDAPSVSGILSRLPKVTIKLAKTDFLTGTLTFKGSDGSTIDRTALTVTLTDEDGKVTTFNADGTFKAVAGTYTYTISGAGVEYTTGTVILTEEGTNAFEIELVKTSDTAWDGETQTEPDKDENGVYQIGTGAELAWFVNASAKANVSGVLTANIDLAKYAWLDVASSRKVELDGANHEITGLSAKSGLFKQIGAASHISNLTLRGTSVGGGSVTGYASGSGIVIENCFSYVTINGSGNSVGGIVGYTNSSVTIRNCANFGDVTGSTNVGGIVGSFTSDGPTITGCYNTGAITATGSNAGGIFGNSGYGINVTGCYNTGVVTASGNAGGIGGQAKGGSNWFTGEIVPANITACYTTGDNAAFGSVDADSVTLSKCYSLKADDANAAALTVDADLNEQFGLVCNGGYPALTWQKNVTFHEADADGIVTAPTCTEGGYTTHTCSKCNMSFRDTYVAAQGHDWCTHTAVDESCGNCTAVPPTCTEEGRITRTCKRAGCDATKTDVVAALGHKPGNNEVDRHPAYRTYTCEVCGQPITEWNDERLQYVVMSGTGITSISMADGTYPWQYNEENKHFESANAGVGNSASETSFSFTLTTPAVLTFDYGVSSEADCDKFTAALSDGTDSKTLLNGISGEKTDSVSVRLTAGTWVLTLKYTKDSYTDAGSDMAYIGNVKLETTTEPVQDVANIYMTTGDYLTGLGAPETGSIGGEWAALGLARSGRDVPGVADYYASVVEYVNKYADAQEHLDGKPTENARIILALTAIGKDVTSVGGHDLLKGLNSMEYIKSQSVNGPVWTLLALDSYNYAVSGDVTRDKLVEAILGTQLPNGSWPVMKSKTTADIDMTAMAIQALAPYYSTNEAVKEAVDHALTFLTDAQTQDGGFAENVGGTNSSESAAQVLVALCAMKIDPLTDSRFIKNNHTVLDALCSYYVTGGGFKHDAGSELNAMATEQGYYALAAYYRMKAEQTFLYDMTDVKVVCAEGNHRGSWTVVKAATCTEDGTEKRICTVCGAEETRTIKAKGHTFGEWTVTKKATCTENGSQKHVCENCQAEETQTIKALGHKFGKWVVTKEATRTEKGLKTRTCETCGATETKVIPARGSRPSTDKPADTVKSSQTGDNSQMTLWMGGVLLSAAALVVLNRKKKHSEE